MYSSIYILELMTKQKAGPSPWNRRVKTKQKA